MFCHDFFFYINQGITILKYYKTLLVLDTMTIMLVIKTVKRKQWSKHMIMSNMSEIECFFKTWIKLLYFKADQLNVKMRKRKKIVKIRIEKSSNFLKEKICIHIFYHIIQSQEKKKKNLFCNYLHILNQPEI